MEISGNKSNIFFKGATININALSDTHGNINKTDTAYQTLLRYNAFEKEKEGNINYLITGGDWFISGDRKGLKTAPAKPLMYFQLDMYNKFVGEIKKKYPKLVSIFVPGNHDFDGGAQIFKNAERKLDSTIISSNLDVNNSVLLKEGINSGHIVESKIDFVQDDKNQNVSYPVMNIGVSPVNMKYYKKDLKGINFIDNISQSQKEISPDKYTATMKKVQALIKKFKEKYPDGIVILTSHTGVNFAQECAKQGGIDIIFNAHEHKNNNESVNGTPIINLFQNFNKLVNAKIKIDDDGKKNNITIKEFYPPNETFRKKSPVGTFYKTILKKDTRKIYTIKSTDSSMHKLGINGVRSGNSHLANFVTDILLAQAKEVDSDIDIFALNSSSIRSGFYLKKKPNTNYIEIFNCLAGISPEQADVYTTDVTGKDLMMMIIDNFLFNMKDKEKNPLIQYAGIRINKTKLLEEYHNGKNFEDLCKYVRLSSTEKCINAEEIYRIANPVKYFEKSANRDIKEMLSKSKPLKTNVHKLFSEYFDRHKTIIFTPEERLI